MSTTFKLQGYSGQIFVLPGEPVHIIATGISGHQIKFEAAGDFGGYVSDTFPIAAGENGIVWSFKFTPESRGASIVRASLLDAAGNVLGQTETTIWLVNPDEFRRMWEAHQSFGSGGGHRPAPNGPVGMVGLGARSTGSVGAFGPAAGNPGASSGHQPAPSLTTSVFQGSDALSDVLKAKQAELLARLGKR